MLERILLPLDGSTLAECVLPHAVALARATMAKLVLARAVEPPAEADSVATDPLHWHLRKAETQAYLEEVSQRLRQLGLTVETVVLEGPAAERVVEYIREHTIDLILLSSHGKSGLSGWNISSVVQKIILRANCSIMLVRAYETGPADLESLHYRRILVPLDGSRRAEYVLPIAMGLAEYADSDLLLANVVVRPEMARRSPISDTDVALAEEVVARNREETDKYLEQLRSWLPQKVSTHLLVGESVITSLHRFVEEEGIDVIALSAHGYSGDAHRPYGSVVTSFIVYGSTPLLIIQDLPADQIESTEAEVRTAQRLVTGRVEGGVITAHARSEE